MVEITIFNLTGQLMKRFEGVYPAGEHAILWDGMQENGQVVSAGMYLVRMQLGEFVSSIRMSKL